MPHAPFREASKSYRDSPLAPPRSLHTPGRVRTEVGVCSHADGSHIAARGGVIGLTLVAEPSPFPLPSPGGPVLPRAISRRRCSTSTVQLRESILRSAVRRATIAWCFAAQPDVYHPPAAHTTSVVSRRSLGSATSIGRCVVSVCSCVTAFSPTQGRRRRDDTSQHRVQCTSGQAS